MVRKRKRRVDISNANEKEERPRWQNLLLGSFVNRYEGLETGEKVKPPGSSAAVDRRTTVARKNWGLAAGISFSLPVPKLSITFSTKPAKWDFKRSVRSTNGKFEWSVGQLKFHVK